VEQAEPLGRKFERRKASSDDFFRYKPADGKIGCDQDKKWSVGVYEKNPVVRFSQNFKFQVA